MAIDILQAFEGPPPPLDFVLPGLQAFEGPPPPLDFVLPGMLAGTVGGMISPGGAGKSMLALELSILVATGHDLAGFGSLAGGVKHTGRVAFLAAEDPALALRHRLHAIGKHLNKSLRVQYAEACEIEPLVGLQADLCKADWLAFVEAMATGRRLLFLDTLRRFHGLDENDSGQMAQLTGVMEGVAHRTGCAIVFLHHASKAAALSGQGDMQQALRGSSVLTDNVRWQMYLAGCTKDEAEQHGIDPAMRGYFVRAGVSKQNYGPPDNEIWMRRVEGGVLLPAQFATSPVTTMKKKGKRRETFGGQMARDKATVISWGSINGLVTYDLELAHDKCRITAELRPEDEKVIGKPEIGDVVVIWKTTGSRPGGYIITGRNGKIGPGEPVW